MIRATINGREVELGAEVTVLEHLTSLGVHPQAVAVEINGEIVPRDGYESTAIRDRDVVEIVRMVGGGAD